MRWATFRLLDGAFCEQTGALEDHGTRDRRVRVPFVTRAFGWSPAGAAEPVARAGHPDGSSQHLSRQKHKVASFEGTRLEDKVQKCRSAGVQQCVQKCTVQKVQGCRVQVGKAGLKPRPTVDRRLQ